MAQTRVKVEVKPRGQRKPVETDLGFHWGTVNSLLLGLGVALIALGFFSLSRGSITLAPVMLVAGYVVFIPASLVFRGGSKAQGE
jgi:hypothetical protein